MFTKKDHTELIINRIHASKYWGDDFIYKEKTKYESLGFKYIFSNGQKIDHSDILITNTHTSLSDFSDDEIEKIKLIIHPNSGYDQFSFDLINKIKVPIILGNSLRSHAVSEVILSEIFSHFSLPKHHEMWDETRRWDRKLLKEQKILIVGLGLIGNIIKQTLLPLVENIYVYDPFKGFDQFEKNTYDVIILCSSLNKTSKHMINQETLNYLATDGLIINCARGELIETSDLMNFLKSNLKASAYLDVFENEPCNFKNIALPNLKTTSHIAGVHRNLEEKNVTFIYEVLKNFKLNDLKTFEEMYFNINLKNRIHDDFVI